MELLINFSYSDVIINLLRQIWGTCEQGTFFGAHPGFHFKSIHVTVCSEDYVYANKYNYGVILEHLTPVDLSMEYSEAITSYGRAQGGLKHG